MDNVRCTRTTERLPSMKNKNLLVCGSFDDAILIERP